MHLEKKRLIKDSQHSFVDRNHFSSISLCFFEEMNKKTEGIEVYCVGMIISKTW